jgi:DNA repair ATPase RecN
MNENETTEIINLLREIRDSLQELKGSEDVKRLEKELKEVKSATIQNSYEIQILRSE